MRPQPLVALDVGSTKVACAIGIANERMPGFELLGTSCVPYAALSEGWLSDPLLVGRTIEQALEATAVSAECDQALVSIRHPLIKSEIVKASIALGDEPVTIRMQDLERLKQNALAQALGIDREALLVERLSCSGNGFDSVRDPRGLSATRLQGTFNIITIPVAARRALVQAVESAGLEVARLTYTLPLALAEQANHELRHQRVLVVDVGGLSTDAGIFIESALAGLEVIPFGGIRLAMSIATELNATLSQAVTWSLQGKACPKTGIREIIEGQWQSLQASFERLLSGAPKPDALLLTGRGVLIDGFAEWVEQATGLSASVCRSPRTLSLGDLSRQVGLGAAIGLLEATTGDADEPAARPNHLIGRFIDRTRTILTEYF